MTLHRAHKRQQGFSMLEVLIAVLVFSLGMIGLAGLLIFSIQSNHVAYLRTQATFLAHNMAARMGANPAGVWANDYNINDLDAVGAGIGTSCSTGCTPADLATHDIQEWSQQVHTFLPNAHATIDCETGVISGYVASGGQFDLRPPYGGTCEMTLTWDEAGAASGANQSDITSKGISPHTFAWVFQP
jgi:type IV pilus assembly protein PilV